MAYKVKPSPAARVQRARKAARDAIAHSNVVAGNEALVRSTRSRAVYKIKADALDQVLAILEGKVTA